MDAARAHKLWHYVAMARFLTLSDVADSNDAGSAGRNIVKAKISIPVSSK